jgi:soluble lytic murein transglycosylase-like protein
MDPATNIETGTKFLASLIKHYQGDLPLALAAYHAGQAKIDRVVQQYGRRWRESPEMRGARQGVPYDIPAYVDAIMNRVSVAERGAGRG